MSRRMTITIKHAQYLARHLGVSIRKTSAGDFRINRKGDPEKYACYEETIGEALATAVAIFKWGRNK